MAEICCGGGICDSLVTINYMREMAKKRLAYGSYTPCVSVSNAASFSSCCTADESAYTPTYKEITDGLYANYRVLNNNPANDVDGFSAYTQSLDSNCCPISLDEKNLPTSALTFGYTEITGITLSAITKPSDICDSSWSILKKNKYLRHTFGCSNNSIVEIGSPTEAESPDWINVASGRLSKSYGNISNGTSYVTFVSHTENITSSGNCGYSASTSTTISKDGYYVSISLDCDSHSIECDGGTVTGSYQDYCDDLSIDNIYYEKGDLSWTASSGSITIDIPDNHDDGTDSITVTIDFSIGDKNGSISCEFPRETCGSVTPVTGEGCNPYWGVDVFPTDSIIHLNNNCSVF